MTRHRPAVLPTHFQVRIEVEMIDIGAELVNVGANPVTYRVMPIP